ncbi:MAG TPA: ATP-binding cassette domain-containing protein [Pyrinomonadaceae bacterium]|nr:ATP-binding cassette domain-containing protein [Pyrinomonadaceae bacterium]
MEIARTASLSPGETAAEVVDLSIKRGGKILFKNMTWSLAAGRMLAVTGPSGSGKSSLLACLRGQIDPASGGAAVMANGRCGVGTVFQHLRLTQEASVLTNVLSGSLGAYPWWKTILGFSSNENRRAFSYISELGLAPLVHKPIRNISGGEQQRTAIARLLMQDPTLILIDEPTSDLDADLARQVLTLFSSLCTQRGKAVVAVLHDTDLVKSFADQELVIHPDFENGWALRTITG